MQVQEFGDHETGSDPDTQQPAEFVPEATAAGSDQGLTGSRIERPGSTFAGSKGDLPYPPSWVDRLEARIEHLPGPAWLFYTLAALFLALLNHVIFWMDGSLPFGSVERLLARFAIVIVYIPALYHYLTRTASRSLKAFRPLLETDDAEVARIDYALRTLPRWLGGLLLFVGVFTPIPAMLTDPAGRTGLVPQSALGAAWEYFWTAYFSTMVIAVLFRSIRQLRLVSKLHARAANIDLLDLGPSHAFSALTARTGLGLVIMLSIPLFFGQYEFTALDIFNYAGNVVAALAIFAVPMLGMHTQLEKARDRALKDTNGLLRLARKRLHNQVKSLEYEDVADTDKVIAALIREREFVKKTSTWPWNPGTIWGFASTLLLPIFLFIVTRLLERLF